MGARDPLVSARPRLRASMVTIVAALAIGASLILSMGVTAIFWVPLVFLGGIAMLTVWSARRRRQKYEGRDNHDVKDPRNTPRSWPTDGVVDDRLPEP